MIVSALSPFLLWTARDPPAVVQQQVSCLSYYGSSPAAKQFFYGTSDVHCAALIRDVWPAALQVEQDTGTQLVWLERDLDALDSSLQMADTSTHSFHGLQRAQGGDGQFVLSSLMHSVEVLYEAEDSTLLRMDRSLAQTIDLHLPRFWKSVLLPAKPISMIPVPPPSVERVRQLLDTVKYDPVIESLVESLSVSQMRDDIRYLTGEDPKSPIISRHSFSEGVRLAAAWLKDRFEETGASCELKAFRYGYAPNVICSYPAIENTTETVLLSAHYDSRGSFGSIRAPGGDDDGSGTITLLAIARATARGGVLFKKNVQLCAFAGEEQGLVGSRAYAQQLRQSGANLTLMVQADMVAYHKPGEPPQLGLPDRIGTPEVTQLVANLSSIYSPELHVGYTPACCSDHQSFHEQGFPATQVFERAGPIADPMYHNSGDVSDRVGYDFEQVKSIAKIQFATLLHAAGYELLKSDVTAQ